MASVNLGTYTQFTHKIHTYVSKIASYSKNSYVYVASYNVHMTCLWLGHGLSVAAGVVRACWQQLIIGPGRKLQVIHHGMHDNRNIIASNYKWRRAEDDGVSEAVPVGVSFCASIGWRG